jgi:hypothetical protein
MKKKLTATIFFLSALIYSSFAEEKKQERLDELLQERTEYICSKIGLTPEEKEKFVPLYKEFQQKRMGMYEKDNRFHFKKINEKKSYTEEEYREMNEFYTNEKLNNATTDKIYYEKFREIIPESKIYGMFQAEKAYRRDLIKRVENKGRSNIHK